jgi:hypothetical protein
LATAILATAVTGLAPATSPATSPGALAAAIAASAAGGSGEALCQFQVSMRQGSWKRCRTDQDRRCGDVFCGNHRLEIIFSIFGHMIHQIHSLFPGGR